MRDFRPQSMTGVPLRAVLGLSQVVYVAGKLVAPPSISDLDTQITALHAAEKKLRDTLDLSAAGFSASGVVSWGADDKLGSAKIAYSDYLESWSKTATIMTERILSLDAHVALLAFPPNKPMSVPAVSVKIFSHVLNSICWWRLSSSGPTTWWC